VVALGEKNLRMKANFVLAILQIDNVLWKTSVLQNLPKLVKAAWMT
jgi:hypothetical protein